VVYVLRVTVDCSVLGNVRRKAVGGVAALARARLIKLIRGEESSGGACRDDTSSGSRTYTRTRTYVINVYVGVLYYVEKPTFFATAAGQEYFPAHVYYYNIHIMVHAYKHTHTSICCARVRAYYYLLRCEA